MTKVISDIAPAVNLLKQNEVVAIPTETVYGLAGNAFSEMAVSKIFEAKNRPSFDPLIVHIASFEMLDKVAAKVPNQYLKVMEKCWPGPLTLLFEKSAKIPDLVTSGSDKVAVRWPQHPVMQTILESLDFPLAAPSANPFGYISPTSALHVLNQLEGKIPCIVDGGESQVGVESTILDYTQTGWVVLRLGGISVEQIEEVVGEKVSVNVSSSRPQAPGMLDQHYAPKTKLSFGDIEMGKTKYAEKNWIAMTLTPQGIYPHNAFLSATGNLQEAAANLFKVMRRLDDENWDIILAEKMPEMGLGRAINDRLFRASIK
jgi:L-threonylcarbamoyladenylate synthase